MQHNPLRPRYRPRRNRIVPRHFERYGLRTIQFRPTPPLQIRLLLALWNLPHTVLSTALAKLR